MKLTEDGRFIEEETSASKARVQLKYVVPKAEDSVDDAEGKSKNREAAEYAGAYKWPKNMYVNS